MVVIKRLSGMNLELWFAADVPSSWITSNVVFGFIINVSSVWKPASTSNWRKSGRELYHVRNLQLHHRWQVGVVRPCYIPTS